MPEFVVRPDIEDIFGRIRKTAADKQGGLVLLRPDRTHLVIPRLEESPQLKTNAEEHGAIHSLGYQAEYRRDRKHGISGSERHRSRQIHSIPALLMGLTYIGHGVWIFEGHPSAIAAGCRDADVLFVDGGMLPFLQADWHSEAFQVMRHPGP